VLENTNKINFLSIGKAFAILTVLLSWSYFYFVYFSITFICCQFFIWFSKSKFKTKILWTLMPLIGGACCMLAVQYLHHLNLTFKTLKVEYILPENYKGAILVFDNMSCGQSDSISNERLVLKVSEKGRVYYSGDLINKGYIDNMFSIQNGNKYDRLENLDVSMFWDDNIKAYPEYTRHTTGVFNIGHINYLNEKNKIKELFVVTTKADLDTINWYNQIKSILDYTDTENCK
jgi:hypothetical protein